MTSGSASATPAGPARSGFLGRAAVSLAGIAVTTLLAFTTRGGFAMLLGAAIFAGGYEYRAISAPDGRRLGRVLSGLGALIAGATIVAAARRPFPPLDTLTLVVVAAGFGLSTFFARRGAGRASSRRFTAAIAGPLYFGALPALLLPLQVADGAPRGYWVALALAVSWGGGIGGFVAGRLWGRRLLAPSVSPRKTVEGAIGSFVFGSAVAMLVWSTDRAALPLATAAWLVPSAQLLSQAGDLVESALKRRCGVNDSGRLLLAQGGVLDSLDGFCLAAPWLYFASVPPWR